MFSIENLLADTNVDTSNSMTTRNRIKYLLCDNETDVMTVDTTGSVFKRPRDEPTEDRVVKKVLSIHIPSKVKTVEFPEGRVNAVNMTALLLDLFGQSKQRNNIYKTLQNYSKKHIADNDKNKVTDNNASGQAPTWLNRRGFLAMIDKLSKHTTWGSEVTKFVESQQYVELVTLLNQDVAPIILSMDERNIALMNGWKECQGARPQAQGTEKWVWLTHVMKYEFAYQTEINGLFKIRDNWAAEIRMNFCPNNPSHTHPMVCIISPEGIYLQPVLPQDDEEHTGEFGLCKNYKTIVKRFGVRDGKPNCDHLLLQFFGEGPLRIAGSLIDPPLKVQKVPTDWKKSKHFLSQEDINAREKNINYREPLQRKAMQMYYNRKGSVGYSKSWKENQMNMYVNIVLSFQRSILSPSTLKKKCKQQLTT